MLGSGTLGFEVWVSVEWGEVRDSVWLQVSVHATVMQSCT
jgi:hypothetical protein